MGGRSQAGHPGDLQQFSLPETLPEGRGLTLGEILDSVSDKVCEFVQKRDFPAAKSKLEQVHRIIIQDVWGGAAESREGYKSHEDRGIANTWAQAPPREFVNSFQYNYI